jgi:hypothetical protein
MSVHNPKKRQQQQLCLFAIGEHFKENLIARMAGTSLV